MAGQVILYFDDQADALRFALAAGSVMSGEGSRATDDLVQETARATRIRLDAANAGKVKNLLMEKRFCLVLHCHMHFGWFAAERWPQEHDDWTLHIAAAPTLGSRETQHQLGYNVVEVAREGSNRFSVTVTRMLHDTGGGWHEAATMGPIELDCEGSTIRQIESRKTAAPASSRH